MTAATAALAPGPSPGSGAGATADNTSTTVHGDFRRWEREYAAAGCSHPIQLRHRTDMIDLATGELAPLYGQVSAECGNRREAVCPSCSATYKRDARQLVRAGLAGGKGIPGTIAAHPCVFATLTAPSFGPVHARRMRGKTVLPCRPRRDAKARRCPHGRDISCPTRHVDGDPRLGQPMCPDCYDYTAAVLFNAYAGKLWRRFTTYLPRHLARQLGITQKQLRTLVEIRFVKVAEYQARGVVHFHAVIRLDGPGQDYQPPPPGITADILGQAIGQAAAAVRLHVIPGIGKKRIDKLTVRETQTWLNRLPGTCQCCAQKKDAKRRRPRCCALGECCQDFPSRRVIEASRGTLRAALNHAMRDELISRNVAELVTLPKARKKNRRKNSWTVDEARKFLECSRNEDDPLYPLWVLILVLRLRKGEALGLIEPDDKWRTDEDHAVIDLEWQLQRVGGHPLTHKQALKADGSTDTLPLPPICVTALRIARRNQDRARTADWPDTCICGEKHELVFTTRTGHPIEPRNINRAFDVRCARYGIRRITLHDTRRTCGSLLAALDVHPRIAMAILRHSRIALTMEIYTQVPDKVTRDALRRLSDWLDHDEDQGDEARS